MRLLLSLLEGEAGREVSPDCCSPDCTIVSRGSIVSINNEAGGELGGEVVGDEGDIILKVSVSLYRKKEKRGA